MNLISIVNETLGEESLGAIFFLDSSESYREWIHLRGHGLDRVFTEFLREGSISISGQICNVLNEN